MNEYKPEISVVAELDLTNTRVNRRDLDQITTIATLSPPIIRSLFARGRSQVSEPR
ncbi:hypothetical protein YC2023_101657 [Brassica napus]